MKEAELKPCPFCGGVSKWLEVLPPADVVPKSEVERLQGENKAANRVIKNLEGDIEVYQEAYKNVRSEVAREIFEEIEKVIGDKYESYVFGNNDLDSIEQDAIINFSDDLSDSFEELKKKYTEGKHNGHT